MRSKFLSLIGIIILSVQCSNDNITSKGNSAPENDDSILGEEFEAMDISQSQCKVSSEGGMSVVEVANYDWWFISEVEAQIGDDDAITIYNTKSQNPLEYIEGSWFRLELIDEGKRQLRIIINKNETALARRLYVSISAGVASGEIVVDQQSANIKDLTTDVEGVFHYLSSEGGACESRLISNDMWSIIQVEEQIGDGDVQVHNPSEMLSSAIIEDSWFKVEVPKSNCAMLNISIGESYQIVVRKLTITMAVGEDNVTITVVQEPDYVVSDNGEPKVRNSRHDVVSKGGEYTSELLNYRSWRIQSVAGQLDNGELVEMYRYDGLHNVTFVVGSWYKVEIPKEHGNMLLFDITENSTSQQRKVVVCMMVAGEEYSLEAVQKPAYL